MRYAQARSGAPGGTRTPGLSRPLTRQTAFLFEEFRNYPVELDRLFEPAFWFEDLTGCGQVSETRTRVATQGSPGNGR